MGIVEVNDGTQFRLHYEIVEGVVPADTLCIHGNLASNVWWEPFVTELRERSKQKEFKTTGRLILAEFRGCGKSSNVRSLGEVSMHRFAEDMLFLLGHEKLEKVNLIGHSTGGFIAALMLSKKPELFSRAVLLDSVGPQGVIFDPSMEVAFKQMQDSREVTSAVMASTIHNVDAKTDLFKKIVDDAHRAVKATGWDVVRALGGVDVRAIFKNIQHPILILHGEVDPVIPVSDAVALKNSLTNSKLHIVPSHGHSLNIEDPKMFTNFVEAHLFAENSSKKATEAAQQI